METALNEQGIADMQAAFLNVCKQTKETPKIDYSQFQPIENMDEVTHIFKKIFDGKKTYGTDTAKMGFFHEQICAAKVDGNQIIFALPFNGPMAMLREILEKTHYNKTNSIMVVCDVNDDNTQLTATFYSKEFKLFSDL